MTLNPASETSPAGDPQPDRPSRPRRESRRARPPLFTGEPTSPQPGPEDLTPPPPDEPGSASGSPEGEKAERSRKPRASSVSPSDRRQLKSAIAAGVQLVGVQLHQVAVQTEDEAEAGLWLTDEQDQEGIAEPLSSIVARRGGV